MEIDRSRDQMQPSGHDAALYEAVVNDAIKAPPKAPPVRRAITPSRVLSRIFATGKFHGFPPETVAPRGGAVTFGHQFLSAWCLPWACYPTSSIFRDMVADCIPLHCLSGFFDMQAVTVGCRVKIQGLVNAQRDHSCPMLPPLSFLLC